MKYVKVEDSGQNDQNTDDDVTIAQAGDVVCIEVGSGHNTVLSNLIAPSSTTTGLGFDNAACNNPVTGAVTTNIATGKDGIGGSSGSGVVALPGSGDPAKYCVPGGSTAFLRITYMPLDNSGTFNGLVASPDRITALCTVTGHVGTMQIRMKGTPPTPTPAPVTPAPPAPVPC